MLVHYLGYVQSHRTSLVVSAPLFAGLALGLASLITSIGSSDILFGSLGNAFVGGFVYAVFYSITVGLVLAISIMLSNIWHRGAKRSTAYAYTLPAISMLLVALFMLLSNMYARLVQN